MKRTHIPFYETYEDAKNEDKSKLHYFKVVDEHKYHQWQYDKAIYTDYLLVDENNPELMIVATYNGSRYVALTETVQSFLDRKFRDDMERLCRNYYSNIAL